MPFVYGKLLPAKVEKFFRFGVRKYVPPSPEESNDEKADLLLDLNHHDVTKNKLKAESDSSSSLETVSGEENV